MLNIEELFELCEEYDATYGDYPESIYEGKAVFEFIMEKLVEQGKISDHDLSIYMEKYDLDFVIP